MLSLLLFQKGPKSSLSADGPAWAGLRTGRDQRFLIAGIAFLRLRYYFRYVCIN